MPRKLSKIGVEQRMVDMLKGEVRCPKCKRVAEERHPLNAPMYYFCPNDCPVWYFTPDGEELSR